MSPHTHYSEPWTHFFEVLQLLIRWSGQWTLGLANEASCTAFSSPSSSTVGLWHHLRPTAWDTTVAPGFYSWIILQLFWRRNLQCCVCPVGSSEDELRLCLQLSLVPGQTHLCAWQGSSAFGCWFYSSWPADLQHCPQHQEGGHPYHQVSAIDITKHHNQTVFFAAPGLRQGLGHRPFSPCCACVVKKGPRKTLRLCPSWSYARQENPGTVAMAARLKVATSKGGGCPCRQSRRMTQAFSLLLHNSPLYSHLQSCCCPWRWWP